MSQPKTVAPPPSLNLQDILYVLFKHKWKILLMLGDRDRRSSSRLFYLPHRLRISSQAACALRGGHKHYRSSRFPAHRSR